MSARIVGILGRFVEQVEVNSIDEAFLDLSGHEGLYPDLGGFAQSLRQTIGQWTRVPVSVGLAPTKTLTKVANYFAKRQTEHQGVLLLDAPGKISEALEGFEIGELWSVGWRYEGMLKRNGIRTAAQLRDLPDDWLREKMTVNGLRLAYELRGVPCKLLEPQVPAKKAICTAPSFGVPIHDRRRMTQALVTHLSRAAEKLRSQGSAAGVVTVFLHTNRFRKSPNGESARPYYNSRTVELPHPTSSTAELVHYARAALESIFKFGYEYQKVGVMLSGLVPDDFRQGTLFTAGPDERLEKLSKVIDKINHRHSRDRVRLAGAGYDASWHHRREWLSGRYTTRWSEILCTS